MTDQHPYLQGFYTLIEMFTFKASGCLTGPIGQQLAQPPFFEGDF